MATTVKMNTGNGDVPQVKLTLSARKVKGQRHRQFVPNLISQLYLMAMFPMLFNEAKRYLTQGELDKICPMCYEKGVTLFVETAEFVGA